MDDLIERVRRNLDDLSPSPAPLDDLRERAARRARHRRVGAGVLGVAVAVALIAGAWAIGRSRGGTGDDTRDACPRGARPTGCSSRATARHGWSTPRARPRGTCRCRNFHPVMRPIAIVRRVDALVAWAYRTLVVHPGDEPTFDVLVRDSLFFIPSSAPDRVWVAIVDESQDDGRLTAVREVSIDGRVTVPDTRPPDGAWPVAAVDGNLVFQRSGELLVWDPSTGREVDRLPGQLPVAWQGQLLAWCDGACRSLDVKDMSSGEALDRRTPGRCHGIRGPPRGVLTRRSHAGGRRPAGRRGGRGASARADRRRHRSDHGHRRSDGPDALRLPRLGAVGRHRVHHRGTARRTPPDRRVQHRRRRGTSPRRLRRRLLRHGDVPGEH